jgi:type IV pilus assembly protein PilE
MKHLRTLARWSACRRGFTVIELLITVVVLAVLMAVAYPSYQSQIRKTRRAEAFTALSNVQQAQERHRSTRPAFTDLITEATTASPPGLGLPSTRTSSGYYDLGITLVSGGTTTYVVTATAVAGTSQAADGTCSTLAVRVQGGNVRYGAGGTIDWTSTNTDPQRCWAR